MFELLRKLILDFEELPLETGLPRQLKIETVRGKATICIGVRRSGKSTYTFQVMQGLLDQGVSRQNILYLNFFDDRLHTLKQTGLDIVVEAYFSLYPEKKNTEKVYCFFDEIQTIPGWEPFIDRLMRTENCQVFIIGSSAEMLSKEIATQMRGRALSWEIFPFSFKEFLGYKNIDSTGPWSTKRQLVIRKAFEEYWERGEFPKVAGFSTALRIKTHQEYFNSVLFRDLVERHNVTHPKAVTDLAYRLIDNIGAPYSVNSLTGYLKSLGHKVPKATVSEYIEWFEDAYFLFTVHIFDASLSRVQNNPKKIYCVDHAMVTSVASGILVNSGHLLESLVFITFRRDDLKVSYYKTKNGREVDFIVQMANRTKQLFQICESLADPSTKTREVTALNEAMIELKLKTGTIITRNEERQIEAEGGKIHVVPIWKFLLLSGVEAQ